MIPDHIRPWLFVPSLLGGLLVFLAASVGTWKPATRKRLKAAGTLMLLGFGLLAVLLVGADAAVAQEWGVVSYCVSAIGLAAWLGGEVQPWLVTPRLKRLGIYTFAFAGLWRVWLTHDRESALNLTLITLGVVIAAVLADWVLSRRARARAADAGQH